MQERLSEKSDDKKQAQDLVYASLIDSAVNLGAFAEWNGWVVEAGRTRPMWYGPTFKGVRKFQDLVFRAAWPGTIPELEKSLRTLAIALESARSVFGKHCDHGKGQTNIYDSVPFFSLQWHTQERYDQLLEIGVPSRML